MGEYSHEASTQVPWEGGELCPGQQLALTLQAGHKYLPFSSCCLAKAFTTNFEFPQGKKD